MKEDIVFNVLLWLRSRLCNFIAAGEVSNMVLAGDRTENPLDDVLGDVDKSREFPLQ